MTSEPLVSIGVPVRNGAAFLNEALQLLINQTYRNVEIIISDNNSDDGSSEIIRKYGEIDPRVQIHRQIRTLTAFENFRFVLEHSRGDYFMWAAHDDRRSLDYVESMLDTLESAPDAVLAFSPVTRFTNINEWKYANAVETPKELEKNVGIFRRILHNTDQKCTHIYGLIRKSAIYGYPWPNIEHGPDRVLLAYLSTKGSFKIASKGMFFYFSPPIRKTITDRNKSNNIKVGVMAPEAQCSVECAHALAGSKKRTLTAVTLFAFLVHYLLRKTRKIRPRF